MYGIILGTVWQGAGFYMALMLSGLKGINTEIWSAAKLDASAWNVTWLPAMTSTTVERVRLNSRGVAAPQIRRNLDIR